MVRTHRTQLAPVQGKGRLDDMFSLREELLRRSRIVGAQVPLGTGHRLRQQVQEQLGNVSLAFRRTDASQSEPGSMRPSNMASPLDLAQSVYCHTRTTSMPYGTGVARARPKSENSFKRGISFEIEVRSR